MDNVNSRVLKIASVFGIIFVAYNVVLFVASGIDHEATFWVSYIFMILAFAISIASVYLLKNNKGLSQNWFLGLPISIQTVAYFAIEVVASVIFMILDYDCPWSVAFVVQFIILAIALVLIVLQFLAKDVVNTVSVNTKVKTYRMKTFQLDAESIATNVPVAEIQMAYAKLAEDFRFSDPVSSDATKEVEEQIAYTLDQAKSSVNINDVQAALFYANKASNLLKDSNRIAKMFK